jgi:hypothetical protein
LLIAGAGFMQASIIETISINLSDLHAGSTLSGTFTLPNTPEVGDTAPVLLSFSDPSDYSVATLSATITIGSGTPGDTVSFSPLTFINPSGNSFTTDVDLMVAGAAQCASFPCTAMGHFEDGDPAVFTSMYSIAPATVPEPGYSAVLLISLAGLALRKRVLGAQ